MYTQKLIEVLFASPSVSFSPYQLAVYVGAEKRVSSDTDGERWVPDAVGAAGVLRQLSGSQDAPVRYLGSGHTKNSHMYRAAPGKTLADATAWLDAQSAEA